MKTISFFWILFFLIFLMSCEGPNNSTNIDVKEIKLGPPPYLSMDDVLSSYGTNGFIGIINLDDEFSSIYYNGSVQNEHFSDGKAYFYDSLSNTVPCTSLEFNNYEFVKPYSNQNFYAGGGNHIYQTGLLINFGKSNNLRLIGGKYLTNADTNFYLNNAIFISNLSPGDSIDNDDDLKLQWNATSNTYVEIALNKIDSILAGGQLNNITIGSIIIENTGSFVIQKEFLSQLNAGAYSLALKRYEPIFINQLQNRKILVLCKSIHKINVLIKD